MNMLSSVSYFAIDLQPFRASGLRRSGGPFTDHAKSGAADKRP
jgi:hypothetical protein